MSITKHYGGTLTLDFNPDNARKRYVIVENNQVLTGVSTVLDRVLAKNLTWWAAKCASDYIKENLKPGETLDEVEINKLAQGALHAHDNKRSSAADSGTFVHDWLHAMVRDELKPLPKNEAMREVCNLVQIWWKRNKIEVVLAETPVVSQKLGMAGTPDLIAYINGKLTIVDWKTGKGLYFSSLVQLGFYILMFEEEFGAKVDQVILVNASLTTPFKKFTTERIATLRRNAKMVYDLDKSIKYFEPKLERGDYTI